MVTNFIQSAENMANKKKLKEYSASYRIPDQNSTMESVIFKAPNDKVALLIALIELDNFVYGTQLDIIYDEDDGEIIHFDDCACMEHKTAKIWAEIKPYNSHRTLTPDEERELFFEGKYCGNFYDTKDWPH